jgi:hypothetical protein
MDPKKFIKKAGLTAKKGETLRGRNKEILEELLESRPPHVGEKVDNAKPQIALHKLKNLKRDIERHNKKTKKTLEEWESLSMKSRARKDIRHLDDGSKEAKHGAIASEVKAFIKAPIKELRSEIKGPVHKPRKMGIGLLTEKQRENAKLKAAVKEKRMEALRKGRETRAANIAKRKAEKSAEPTRRSKRTK